MGLGDSRFSGIPNAKGHFSDEAMGLCIALVNAFTVPRFEPQWDDDWEPPTRMIDTRPFKMPFILAQVADEYFLDYTARLERDTGVIAYFNHKVYDSQGHRIIFAIMATREDAERWVGMRHESYQR